MDEPLAAAVEDWVPGRWYACCDWAGCEKFSKKTASAQGWVGVTRLANIGAIERQPVFPGWVNQKYRLKS